MAIRILLGFFLLTYVTGCDGSTNNSVAVAEPDAAANDGNNSLYEPADIDAVDRSTDATTASELDSSDPGADEQRLPGANPSRESNASSQIEGSTADSADDDSFESPLRDIPLPTAEEKDPVEQYVEKQTIEIPNNWTRVTPEGQSEVWIDVKSKHVMVAGRICLQEGGLEMFVCPFFTKEHESVIAVNAQSYQIHTALLAIGANPGSPVQWHPDYKPATGPVVKIDVMWKDPESDTVVTRRAQEMIQNFKTKQPMQLDWVFGGSVLVTDPESGQSIYYGDGGELVCLSNFSTATMDIPVPSTDSNEDLLYAANPETIPPVGTKVYVVFKPQIESADTTTDD